MRPYYSDDRCTIYHGDSREILPQMAPADLMITDPPYEFQKTGGGLIAKRKTYGQIADTLATFDPVEWWNLFRGATKGDHMYVFTSKSCLADFIRCAESGSLSWDLLIYGKENPVPMKNNRYLSSFEYLLFFRGKGCYWNNEAPFEHYSKIKMVQCRTRQFGHPTEKQPHIISQLINISSRPGDTIIDPFLGSGTTLVSAKMMNRKAIGVEVEEKYCEIAAKRLAQEVIF